MRIESCPALFTKTNHVRTKIIRSKILIIYYKYKNYITEIIIRLERLELVLELF